MLSLLALLGVSQTLAPHADAITIARVTRRGYIITDDPGDNFYGDQIPVSNQRTMIGFIAEVTRALSNVPGFHAGRFLATMQIPVTQNPLAFYLPIRNDVRGIGQRSTVDGRSELFDTNPAFGTAFDLDGFLYLNSLRYYTEPRAVNFGRYLICTQEFGHRFGANVEVGPYPTGAVTDAGQGDDASVDADAATDPDASVDADASVEADADTDASADAPAPLARDSLLGRGNTNAAGMVVNRAHWSYFLNSGGSPMEGNAWTELMPGVFQTQRPTFQFSDFDLYVMGLIPPSAVRPTYLITDVQDLPRGISRDSGPEYYNRQVTIRGRRVDLGIDDIIAQNGPRRPAYPDTQRDLDVVWVLLVAPEDVSDALADEFDQAVDSCGQGYVAASRGLGRLVTETPFVEPEDAGPPPEDAGGRDAGPFEADIPPIVFDDAGVNPGDAGSTTDDAGPVEAPRGAVTAAGGCACSAPTGSRSSAGGLCAALAALAVAGVSRRRRASRGRTV
ncbi:MAG: hypothetical protein R3A52_31430 [Polyangiales bacterium]